MEDIEQPVNVHAERDGRPLCGADKSTPGYEAVPLDAAQDPDNDAVFTCGACWLVLSGGVAPMGGTAPTGGDTP